MNKSTNKIIEDIGLFTSTLSHIDEHPQPRYICNKPANIFAMRLAKKLWEVGFILGDYTHLYINYNFSRNKGANGFSLRLKDKYHPWLRYYEYGVSDLNLDTVDLCFFAESIKQILIKEYSDINKIDIAGIVDYVLANGENTEIEYKRKTDGDITAVITVRILDSGNILPKVTVYRDGNIIASKMLTEAAGTGALGAITITKHSVTINPKTAAYYCNLQKTIIEF